MSRVTFKTKRVYAAPARADGCRLLVDRLWPRGLSKEKAAVDAWLKELAPSAALRTWFGHDPARWEAFRVRYRRELAEQAHVLEQVKGACRGATVTLVFGAKDELHNNAVVLKEFLERQGGAK